MNMAVSWAIGWGWAMPGKACTEEILPKEVFRGCVRGLRPVYRAARRGWMRCRPAWRAEWRPASSSGGRRAGKDVKGGGHWRSRRVQEPHSLLLSSSGLRGREVPCWAVCPVVCPGGCVGYGREGTVAGEAGRAHQGAEPSWPEGWRGRDRVPGRGKTVSEGQGRCRRLQRM